MRGPKRQEHVSWRGDDTFAVICLWYSVIPILIWTWDADDISAELTSPTPGIVHSIKAQTGQIVKVGQVLCEIRTEEEGEVGEEGELAGEAPSEENKEVEQAEETSEIVEKAEEKTEQHDAQTESSKPLPVEEFVPEKSVNLDEDHSTSTGVQFSGEATVLPSAPAAAAPSHSEPVPARRERVDGGTKKILLTSPATRALAGRLGIDLNEVDGSGDKGRITREDVQKHADRSTSAGPTVSSASIPTAAATATGNRAQWPEVTKVDFGRTRKVMYRALGAQAEVPHFG